MAKLTLTDLGSLTPGSNTAINTNNTAIETAMENTLSRDGTSPNEMESDLDMNSNRIYNLPVPVGLSDAARWQDVVNLTVDSILDPTASFAYLNLATNFATTNVGPTIEAVQVAGYSTVGVGPALWRKVASLPTHAAYRTSLDGYYFVPDVIQLDSTMSPATTGDQVIDAAIALGCGFKLLSGQTGSITLGPSGADFSSISTLQTFLSKSSISENATLTIELMGWYSASAATFLWNFSHPDGKSIKLDCNSSYSVITGRTIQSSGHSVSGTQGDYTVVFHLDDVTGITAGDILRVNNVKSNYRIQDGFWASDSLSIGRLNQTGATTMDVGNATGTAFVDTVFENALSTSDLILWKGQTRRVTAITDGNTFTISAAFTGTAPATEEYWYRLAGGFGTGNVATSPVPGTPSTTVNVTDSSVLKVGAILVTDDQCGRVVSIDSPTAVTVHCEMDISANSPFAMIGLSYCFEGAHEILSVDSGASTVTVQCKAQLPEDDFDFSADYIKGGDCDVVRAGFKNTGTGDILNFRSGGGFKQIDNLGFFPGSSGYAIETGTTQTLEMPPMEIVLGVYFTVVGGAAAIFAFLSSIKCMSSGGTTAYNYKAPMISGCTGVAHIIHTWMGKHYLRGVKITGCTNTYAYFGSGGASFYTTELHVIAGCNTGSYLLQGCGNTGDYQKYYFTGWVDGDGSEAGNFVGFRSVGTASHDTLMRSIGHGGTAMTYNVGCSGRIAGGLIMAAGNYGVINNDSSLEATGLIVMGCPSGNYYSTGRGSIDCIRAAFGNTDGSAIHLLDNSTMTGSGIVATEASEYNLRVSGRSYFNSSGAVFSGGGTADIHIDDFGGDIYIPSYVGSPTLGSGFTLNQINDGRWIRNTNTVYPIQALTADLANNFAVINSDARATFNVTVTGAAVGDIALVTTTNSSYIGDTATRITLRAYVSAADTVTVEAMNDTATNSSDPANLTYRVVVLKFT